MKISVFDNDDGVALAAARMIAAEARRAVAERGIFTFAVSGGKTPWTMLKDLASEDLPWLKVHLFQIDERIAPIGDSDRNLTHLYEIFRTVEVETPLPLENIHPMPVNLNDPMEGAKEYEQTIRKLCGTPPVLDLAHLGLGPDGHTASLVPGDAVLDVVGRDVALTGVYQGRRRMTLTFEMINRSRMILWLATGEAKVPMIARLQRADQSIPAGKIIQENAFLLTDTAAAAGLQSVP